MIVINEGGKLKVNIDGAIGESWFDDSGNTLKSVSAQIGDFDGGEIEATIKSNGGDLIEGFAIHDLFKASKAKVTARMTGLVASAGTIVAMGADERVMTPNAQFMIHRVMTGTYGNVDEHEKSIEALKRFDDDVIDIYRKITGKRKSEIAGLMKEERIINAKEALEWGFIDRIEKANFKNQIETEMEILKVLNVKDEAELVEKFTALQSDSATMKAELETKNAEIEAMKAKIEAMNQARNEAIVNAAMKAGKFGEDMKDVYLNLLKTDFENTEKAINAMKQPGKVIDFLNGAGSVQNEVRDYDWYMKNDVKALMQMEKENPEQYKAIFDAKENQIRKGK